MESHVKFAGHPIHPMLIVFPLGVLSSAVIFDIVYLITGSITFPAIAFYDIAVGLIGGLLAALFGFADWLHVPGGTRAKTVGAWHGLGNATIVILFVVSWLLRRTSPGYIPTSLALIFSFAGILLAVITAWLGGEMVDRLGVGVDRGANVNAPSSLSSQPAAARFGAGAVAGRGSGDFESPPEARPDPDRPEDEESHHHF